MAPDVRVWRNPKVVIAVVGLVSAIVTGYLHYVYKPSQGSTNPVRLAIFVRDAKTDKPVSNAEVTLVRSTRQEEQQTDSLGTARFDVDSEKDRATRVYGQAKGYSNSSLEIDTPKDDGSYILYLKPDDAELQQTPVKQPGWHDEDPDGKKYETAWSMDPGCRNPVSDPATHHCQFSRTQMSFAGDNTPFDHWDLSIDAPGPVTKVFCDPTGSNEFQEVKGQREGKIEGSTARCTGWINGGDAPIQMMVDWKQRW